MSDSEEKDKIDQEKLLDNYLTIVKSKSYQMKKSIESNKLRNSLKYAKSMLDTLKSENLKPENYYCLYMSIFDEMQYMYNYFREEARRGRIMEDLYNIVQQCEDIIPRLYLLICVASVFIENSNCEAIDIIFDVFTLIKGVQNPVRGLFCRYFFLQMIKDKFPENDESVKLLLENLEEMDILFIRVGLCKDDEEYITNTQRNKFKNVIGENITRLAGLHIINEKKYKKELLPKILEIVKNNKDSLSQEYLLQSIIHAFPDEYNIPCIELIMDTCNSINNINVFEIFMSLLEKLTKYINNYQNNENNLNYKHIFSLIKNSIEKIINNFLGEDLDLKLEKLIEMQVIFIKFVVVCLSGDDLIVEINNILQNCLKLINSSKMKNFINLNIIISLRKILEVPIQYNNVFIFKIGHYSELMTFLDQKYKKKLSIKIIDSLTQNKNKFEIKLDTSEKLSILSSYIRPLLEGEIKNIESESFEMEQNSVCKLLYIIDGDYENIFNLLNEFKNIFIKGGIKRQKYTISALVNAYINLSNNIIKQNNFNNNDINKIYMKIIQCIEIIEIEYPIISFNLLTLALSQIKNNLFEDIFLNLYSNIIKLLDNTEIKPLLIIPLIGILISNNFIQYNNYEKICSDIIQLSNKILKKSDQCIYLLNCANLFYSNIIKDDQKINECLAKAKKCADFAMTDPKNCILFIKIINKYIFFIEKCKNDNEFNYNIENGVIEEMIDFVKHYIQNLRNEVERPEYLPEIEEYFNYTILIIKNRNKNN